MEFVGGFEVIKEKCFDLFDRRADAVEIDLLLSKIRSQTNQVPFVSDHVNKFELPKKSTKGGVSFAFLFACLNRDTNIIAIREPKANHGVGNVRRSPIDDIEIRRPKIIQ